MYNLDKEIIGELLPTKCPSLVGKPKMIFVQACQGQDTDAGVRVRSRSASGTSTDASAAASGLSEAYTIPNYADLLIYQASYHGHYAFRSMSNGSWFIQVGPQTQCYLLCTPFSNSKSPGKSASKERHNAGLNSRHAA